MLFKTTAELVQYLPLDVSFQFTRISPLIKSAENQFIKDILGSAQHTALSSAYQAYTLTPEQTALLPYCQEALAYLAFEKYIPIGNVNISDAGIHIQVNENSKQAFNWQVTDVRSALEDEGYNKLQTLLEFLWANKASYTEWANSTNATAYRSHFINSATEYNQYVDIKSSFKTFSLLRPSIKKVEDLQIKPILESWANGKHAELLAAIAQGTELTGNDFTVYQLIKPALAHLSMAHAVQAQSLSVNSMGVVQSSIQGTDQREQRIPAKNDTKYGFITARTNDARAYLDLLTAKINELLGLDPNNPNETTNTYNDPDLGVFGMF